MKRTATYAGKNKILYADFVREIAKYSGVSQGDVTYILRIAEKIWIEHMRNQEVVVIFPHGFKTFGFAVKPYENWNVNHGRFELTKPRLEVRHFTSKALKRLLNATPDSEESELEFDDDFEDDEDEE